MFDYRGVLTGKEILIEKDENHETWLRPNGQFVSIYKGKIKVRPNDLDQEFATDFGWINYNSSFPPTYTAYDDPADGGRSNYGTTYCMETNSANPSKRTYYSFDTDVPVSHAVDSAYLQYWHASSTYAVPGPGESIGFRISAWFGGAFIGGTIDTGDWDGGTSQNELALSTSPTAPSIGTHNIIIKKADVSLGNVDSDYEIRESCAYSGGYSGTVEYSLRSHQNNSPSQTYATLYVTHSLATTPRTFATIIG